jgi:hypothetical protein
MITQRTYRFYNHILSQTQTLFYYLQNMSISDVTGRLFNGKKSPSNLRAGIPVTLHKPFYRTELSGHTTYELRTLQI